VLLSAGFALGSGLVATRSGFGQNLSALLVGSILTVSGSDLLATAVVLIVLTAVLVTFSRPLTYVGFDPAGARAAGFRTGAWDLVLLLTIEVAVVTVVPAVGTILAIALIVAPAAAARQWSHRQSVVTVLAVGGGLFGLYASSRWNVAAGAAVALSVTGILVLAWAIRAVAPGPDRGRPPRGRGRAGAGRRPRPAGR
jgi:ABC-type Mn2+/Zn2+ transport system permease subunit